MTKKYISIVDAYSDTPKAVGFASTVANAKKLIEFYYGSSFKIRKSGSVSYEVGERHIIVLTKYLSIEGYDIDELLANGEDLSYLVK